MKKAKLNRFWIVRETDAYCKAHYRNYKIINL